MNLTGKKLLFIGAQEMMCSAVLKAKELGVYDQVKADGGSWANVSSKTCGNIVTKAIEIANRAVES